MAGVWEAARKEARHAPTAQPQFKTFPSFATTEHLTNDNASQQTIDEIIRQGRQSLPEDASKRRSDKHAYPPQCAQPTFTTRLRRLTQSKQHSLAARRVWREHDLRSAPWLHDGHRQSCGHPLYKAKGRSSQHLPRHLFNPAIRLRPRRQKTHLSGPRCASS